MTDSKSLLNMIINGDYSAVASCTPEPIKRQFRKNGEKATDVWLSTTGFIAEVERENRLPFHFRCGIRRYAIDAITVSDAIPSKIKIRDSSLQLFLIFYLSVHMLDDIIEDTPKFHSKIEYKPWLSKTAKVNIGIANYALVAYETAESILAHDHTLSDATKLRLLHTFTQNLLRYARSLALENGTYTSKKTFEIKEHIVSGGATELIFDFLLLNRFIKSKYERYMRKALYYLGSLTQIIDDIRDLEDDQKKGNPNLLTAMKKEHKDYKRRLIQLYLKEERLMLNEFRKTKIKINTELITALPWYRFFVDK